jgi:hypothetical protein
MCVPKPGVLEKDIPTATVVDPTVTPGGETTSKVTGVIQEEVKPVVPTNTPKPEGLSVASPDKVFAIPYGGGEEASLYGLTDPIGADQIEAIRRALAPALPGGKIIAVPGQMSAMSLSGARFDGTTYQWVFAAQWSKEINKDGEVWTVNPTETTPDEIVYTSASGEKIGFLTWHEFTPPPYLINGAAVVLDNNGEMYLCYLTGDQRVLAARADGSACQWGDRGCADAVLVRREANENRPAYVFEFKGIFDGEVIPFRIGLTQNIIDRDLVPIRELALNPNVDVSSRLAEFYKKVCQLNRTNCQKLGIGLRSKGNIWMLVANPEKSSWSGPIEAPCQEKEILPSGVDIVFCDSMHTGDLPATDRRLYGWYVTYTGTERLVIYVNLDPLDYSETIHRYEDEKRKELVLSTKLSADVIACLTLIAYSPYLILSKNDPNVYMNRIFISSAIKAAETNPIMIEEWKRMSFVIGGDPIKMTPYLLVNQTG